MARQGAKTGRSLLQQESELTLEPTFTADRTFHPGVSHRVFLCACLCAALVFSISARGETLLEAYKLALQSDPKYKGAQAEALAVGTAIDQAIAGFLPTIKLDLDSTDSRQRVLSSQNITFNAGLATYPTKNYTLSVNQPIFRKDVIERYGQAQSVVKQAGYTLLAAEQDLLLRTTAAYLVVLAATDNVALARTERETVGKVLEFASEKLSRGLGTITNKHDATARFAAAQAREIEAQHKLRDARQALREITGKLIDNMQALREEFPLEAPQPAAVEPWLESALEQNLLLRAKREAVEVAQQEIDRQRAGYFPSLSILATHNRRDAGSTLYGGGSDTETTDVTLRLSVPIFEGGLTTATTQEAAHRYQRSLEELEQERRTVERATRASFDATVSGVALVDALKHGVVAQQSALEAKAEGAKSGLYAVMPVLDATRDLYLVKRDYAQARYDYLYNRLRLKQAAGTLSEIDLVQIGAALQ